uniref:Peroxisomal membrane protein PEX14-like KPWE domain-containing protein n=1 Tax=Denticeps clupeoides TaxID=299321 RepID=A0AAY4E5F1_9TELE
RKWSLCTSASVPLTSRAMQLSSPLSFAEVFRRVQAGEEVPGLQELDVRPCHSAPTVSRLSRVSKPWEKGSETSQIPTKPVHIQFLPSTCALPPRIRGCHRSEGYDRGSRWSWRKPSTLPSGGTNPTGLLQDGQSGRRCSHWRH